jgi:hypothetical protein
MDFLVSMFALALGIFISIAPSRAAKIWGSEQFDKLAPEHRHLFLWGYRALGIVLGLAGVLFAIDSLAS